MSRPATELLQLLHRSRLRVFATADLLTLTGMNRPAATQALRRLAARDLVQRIKRGVWINRLLTDLHPYEVVSHLAAPWPAYVSFYSALADHGVIEEIPRIIYAASSGRPRRYRMPLGDVHIHHLPAHLIWGYEARRAGQASFLLAEPEKAFLDLVYLALIPRSPLNLPPRRGRRWNLDLKKLFRYARRFQFKPLMECLSRNDLNAR